MDYRFWAKAPVFYDPRAEREAREKLEVGPSVPAPAYLVCLAGKRHLFRRWVWHGPKIVGAVVGRDVQYVLLQFELPRGAIPEPYYDPEACDG